MKKQKTLLYVTAVVGIGSFIGFAYYTSWQASLFLILAMWMNNASYIRK